MKTSAILTGCLATTMGLACAAYTKPQPRIAIRQDGAASPDFAKLQKEKLLVLKRPPNIYVASSLLLSRALNIAPLAEEFIPPCSPSPIADRVVKIRINNEFNVKKTGRDIVSKKPGGGVVRTVPEPTRKGTTYDLKLDKTVWDPTDTLIAVKIIMKDPRMLFLDDEHSVTTVTYSPPVTTMFQCLDPIKYVEDKDNGDSEDGPDTPGKEKWESVTFYVLKSQIRTQKFNIRVIAIHDDNIHILPLILDPEVENEG